MALLPQQEVLNAHKVQLFPEGLHLLHLPFTDDIRWPEREPSVIGAQVGGWEIPMVPRQLFLSAR